MQLYYCLSFVATSQQMTLLFLRELLLLLAFVGAADLSFPTEFSAEYSTIAYQIPEATLTVGCL